MGLFNRKNPYEKDALDLETAMRELSERPELKMRTNPPGTNPTLTASSQQALPNFAPQPPPAPQAAAAPPPQQQLSKTSYGIEDAIKLMRELPEDKKEMVITIVQKTLISARVNVSSIIEDAAKKIERLEKKNEKLIQEIRELEEAITLRKLETEKNEHDVLETRNVKVAFENAEIHQSKPFVPSQRAG